MKTLNEIDVSGKKVLVRVDFNVPLDDHQIIGDDTRIRFVLPTLAHLLDQGAKVIIGSHLGRPKGKPESALSLKPVARRLEELLNVPVAMADDCVGEAVTGKVDALEPGEILLLENLRFHPGESENDDAFARALGALCDVYVNDAFAVCHRKNASVEAITAHVPVCAAGFLLEKELKAFESALGTPRRPLTAIVGGAKVSSKLAALYNMMDIVDTLIVGGAMANTFLKARGVGVGASKVEDDLLDEAKKIMAEAEARKIGWYLPVDVVVADRIDLQADRFPVAVDAIPDDYLALDIGPDTVRLYNEVLSSAQTILWNGPMGIFEMAPFAAGTQSIAKSLAASDAFSIVGGGDTVAAVHSAGVADNISYISTGGGAFLMLMEGKLLPAVVALEQC